MIENNYNTLEASLLVAILKKAGVKYFVVSPGSRSTPLVMALAADNELEKKIIYDERAAAYFALNYTRASGELAALVCTSGSAVANYLPAIVEAYKEEIPLLVITADRPEELQNVGANQTIKQSKIYLDYVRDSYTFPAPDENSNIEDISIKIEKLLSCAVSIPRGPVHFNMQFRKPLEKKINIPDSIIEKYRSEISEYEAKYHKTASNIEDIENINRAISDAKNPLLVVGRLNNIQDREEVIRIINKLKIPCFSDISSGINSSQSRYIINHFDLLLEKIDQKPDLILHIGNQLVSANYLNFIKELEIEYIQINQSEGIQDPKAKVKIKIISDLFFLALHIIEREEASQIGSFKIIETEISKILDSKKDLINEIDITRVISNNIKDNCLYLSSSMPIRLFDKFAQFNKEIIVGCNRGASGIDGIISSACGFAEGAKKDCTLVIGDLAFIHDLNSLLLAKNSKQKITIILINNHGGGIFSHLPISQYEEIFEEYFTTPHELNFEGAAKTFGLNYSRCSQIDDFEFEYQNSLRSNDSGIIEVEVNISENIEVYSKIMEKIKGIANKI